MCVGCSLLRRQGCMFGRDPSETQDKPERIFRNRINSVPGYLRRWPLMWFPLPHSSCTLGKSLIKQNSLLSMEVLEGEAPSKYTTNFIQYLTDGLSLPHPTRRLHAIFFPLRILYVQLCVNVLKSIMYSMTVAFVAGNQKNGNELCHSQMWLALSQ